MCVRNKIWVAKKHPKCLSITGCLFFCIMKTSFWVTFFLISVLMAVHPSGASVHLSFFAFRVYEQQFLKKVRHVLLGIESVHDCCSQNREYVSGCLNTPYRVHEEEVLAGCSDGLHLTLDDFTCYLDSSVIKIDYQPLFVVQSVHYGLVQLRGAWYALVKGIQCSPSSVPGRSIIDRNLFLYLGHLHPAFLCSIPLMTKTMLPFLSSTILLITSLLDILHHVEPHFICLTSTVRKENWGMLSIGVYFS